MKIKMCLFPDYIKILSVNLYSPQFAALLKKQGVEIVIDRSWRGDIDSVPNGDPVMLRASTMMSCNWSDLVRLCTKRGHIVFYDDTLVTEEGKCIHDDSSKKRRNKNLIKAANKFLKQISGHDE